MAVVVTVMWEDYVALADAVRELRAPGMGGLLWSVAWHRLRARVQQKQP